MILMQARSTEHLRPWLLRTDNIPETLAPRSAFVCVAAGGFTSHIHIYVYIYIFIFIFICRSRRALYDCLQASLPMTGVSNCARTRARTKPSTLNPKF